MNILLDEQIDVRMKTALSGFSVYTMQDKGWLGIKNGLLRERLNQEGFRFLVTADKNMPFQQNLEDTTFIIILLDTPTLIWVHQQLFIDKLITLLSTPPEAPVKLVHVSIDGLSSKKKVDSLRSLLTTEQLLLV